MKVTAKVIRAITHYAALADVETAAEEAVQKAKQTLTDARQAKMESWRTFTALGPPRGVYVLGGGRVVEYGYSDYPLVVAAIYEEEE